MTKPRIECRLLSCANVQRQVRKTRLCFEAPPHRDVWCKQEASSGVLASLWFALCSMPWFLFLLSLEPFFFLSSFDHPNLRSCIVMTPVTRRVRQKGTTTVARPAKELPQTCSVHAQLFQARSHRLMPLSLHAGPDNTRHYYDRTPFLETTGHVLAAHALAARHFPNTMFFLFQRSFQ